MVRRDLVDDQGRPYDRPGITPDMDASGAKEPVRMAGIGMPPTGSSPTPSFRARVRRRLNAAL